MNYYEILGVFSTATGKEIKSAYRKLAKQYHPDVVKDDPMKQKKMYEIQEAYETLGEEEKRKKYDESLLQQKKQGQKGSSQKQKSTMQNNGTMRGNPFTAQSPFEQFFGFQAGKGMETYQAKGQNNHQKTGPISPDELFASFFGKK